MHSRFSFQVLVIHCLNPHNGEPYTNDPAVHATGDQSGAGVCCSLIYSIHANARWNGVAIACSIQISLAIFASIFLLISQYVDRKSHPLTRLIKERWFWSGEEPLTVAVNIPLVYECAPLGFIGVYLLFNAAFFGGGVAVLRTVPHAADVLLVSTIVAMGTVFLLSTCVLKIGLSRFNNRAYQWIKQATSKKHKPLRPNFSLSEMAGVLSNPASTLARRASGDEKEKDKDVV